MHNQFANVKVSKPWGFEYLLYANDKIELWYLKLRNGCRTSMHCHPAKKTSLVVLDGLARLSFLNSHLLLSPFDKVTIRPGLFHSTACQSFELSLLEVETPPDKLDLVRMEDPYGRAGLPYEDCDKYSAALDEVRLAEHDRDYVLDGCNLVVTRDFRPERAAESALLMVLSGGLVADNGKFVLSAGDVINLPTYRRLTAVFNSVDPEFLILTPGKL